MLIILLQIYHACNHAVCMRLFIRLFMYTLDTVEFRGSQRVAHQNPKGESF